MSVALDHAVTPDSGTSPMAEKRSRSAPLGSTICERRSQLQYFLPSSNQRGTSLLFDREDDPRPELCDSHRSGNSPDLSHWHAFVPGLQPGQIYGYRVHGPHDPAMGMRFDSSKVLLDPYARGVVIPKNYSREAAQQAEGNAATAMKSVVIDPSTYDWEGDVPLGRPSSHAYYLRDARARLYLRFEFRCPRANTRHICRIDGRKFHPPAAWHYCN